MAQELREGQTGVAPDGTRVVVRGGRIVPVEASVNQSGATAAGFTDLGGGWFRAPDGGTFQQNNKGQLIRRTGTAGGDESAQRTARKDFDALQPVKDFREIQSAYGTIEQAAADTSGASDIVLVMAFNKMMDPTSVVREGEFDRAQNVGGVSEQMQARLQGVLTGERLTPEMRRQIADASQAVYEVRRDQYNDTANRAQSLARDDGLSPLSVAREEFRGQRIATNPAYQEEGQANEAQDRARRAIAGYNRQAPLGSPVRPYIVSPDAGPDRLPDRAVYIDIDGSLKVVGSEGDYQQDGNAVVSAQPLAADDTPNSLSAAGYVYDAASDSWKRSRESVGGGPDDRPSPEDNVARLREMPRYDREAGGFMRGVVDGATFGFSDEIAAGIDTVLPPIAGQRSGWQDGFGDAYAHNVATYRGIADADNEDVQGARRIGQGIGMIGGGSGLARGAMAATSRVAPRVAQAMRLAPAVPNATRGANAARLAQNAGRVAVGSAPMGAAAGAGYTEGAPAERFGNALEGAGMAAAFGPAAGAAVSRVAPPVINAFAAGSRVVGRNLGGFGAEIGIPGANALAERSAAPSPIMGGLEMFGAKTPIEANALGAEAASWRANNIEPTFFDVVGDGGQAVGRALATRQTPGRQVAVDFGARRRVGAQDRVSDIARRNISDDPRTSSQVADALEQEQSTLSAAAMDPIRDELVQVSPETATVFRTPGGRAAIEQARAWAANSRQAEELAALARLADDALDAPGNIQISLGTMDRLRRSLSNQARSASDGDSRQGLTSLSRDVRRDATTATPAYGQFLSDYAERAQLDEALEFGGEFLGRRGTEDFARRGAEMLPAQNQVARVAAREAVEEAGNTPAGAARVLDDLSVGRGRGQRADGLLGDDAERLRSNADYGRRELETGRNISPRTGSQTNDNAQGSALVNGAAEGVLIARDVATGNKYGLASRALDFIRRRGFSDEQAEALLVAGLDPARTDELIAAFMQTGMTRGEARNASRVARNLASTGSGSTQR